jgi:hypothetical protein
LQAGATIPLRYSEFCEFRVHIERFQGKLFFMRGWEAMVQKLTLRKDDVLVFKIMSTTSTSP